MVALGSSVICLRSHNAEPAGSFVFDRCLIGAILLELEIEKRDPPGCEIEESPIVVEGLITGWLGPYHICIQFQLVCSESAH